MPSSDQKSNHEQKGDCIEFATFFYQWSWCVSWSLVSSRSDDPTLTKCQQGPRWDYHLFGSHTWGVRGDGYQPNSLFLKLEYWDFQTTPSRLFQLVERWWVNITDDQNWYGIEDDRLVGGGHLKKVDEWMYQKKHDDKLTFNAVTANGLVYRYHGVHVLLKYSIILISS